MLRRALYFAALLAISPAARATCVCPQESQACTCDRADVELYVTSIATLERDLGRAEAARDRATAERAALEARLSAELARAPLGVIVRWESLVAAASLGAVVGLVLGVVLAR